MMPGILIPVIVLGVVAALIPRGLALALPETLPAVALNLGLSAVLLYALGAGLLVALRWAEAPGLGRMIGADPMGALGWAGRLGLLPALVWGPVLIFVELGIAQKVAGKG